MLQLQGAPRPHRPPRAGRLRLLARAQACSCALARPVAQSPCGRACPARPRERPAAWGTASTSSAVPRPTLPRAAASSRPRQRRPAPLRRATQCGTDLIPIPVGAQVDVFSFSMIAYSLFEHCQPYQGMDPVEAARQSALYEKRPQLMKLGGKSPNMQARACMPPQHASILAVVVTTVFPPSRAATGADPQHHARALSAAARCVQHARPSIGLPRLPCCSLAAACVVDTSALVFSRKASSGVT